MTSFLPLWYQALESSFGIVIEATDVDKAISKLYRDRGPDEGLKAITLKRSPTNPKQIWMMK